MPAPSQEELRDFIEDALGEKLSVTARVKQRHRRKKRTFALVILLVLGPITALFLMESEKQGAALLQYPLVSGAIFLVLLFLYHHRLRRKIPAFDYREDVLHPLIRFLDPRLAYRPDQDVAEGKLRTIQVEFGDLKRRTPSASGLFFSSTQPGPCPGPILITPKTTSLALPDWQELTPPPEGLPDNVSLYSPAPSEAETLLAIAAVPTTLTRALHTWSREQDFKLQLNSEELTLELHGDTFFPTPSLDALADRAPLYRLANAVSAAIELSEHLAVRHTPPQPNRGL